jgi:hypothetical protein
MLTADDFPSFDEKSGHQPFLSGSSGEEDSDIFVTSARYTDNVASAFDPDDFSSFESVQDLPDPLAFSDIDPSLNSTAEVSSDGEELVETPHSREVFKALDIGLAQPRSLEEEVRIIPSYS